MSDMHRPGQNVEWFFNRIYRGKSGKVVSIRVNSQPKKL